MEKFFDWLLRLPPWSGPALLAVLFAALLWASWHAKQQIVELLGPAKDPETNEALNLVLEPEEVSIPESDGERRVLRRPLEVILYDFVEERLGRSWTLSNSHVLTGIALLFTFLLIALVLSQKVRGAISNSQDTSSLADAVGALGMKFFISATGVALALIQGAFAARFRLTVVRLAADRARSLAPLFESFESYRTRLDRHHHQNVEATLLTVASTLQGIQDSQQGLKSIEVSVKNIGAELQASLAHMVTQQIAEEMRNVLKDALGELAETLGGQFKTTASAAIGSVQKSLDQIRASVESQAGSQVGKLLEQLRESVSGGFHSESANMSVALRQFGEVVPALEQQLRALVGGLSTDLRTQQETGARTQEAVFGRLDAVLAALGEQQNATTYAIAQISHASKQGADDVALRMQQAGTEAVAAMFKASSGEVENVVSRLQAAAARQGDLGAHVEQTARAIEVARDGLQQCASVIEQLSVSTRSIVDGLRVAAQEVVQSQRGVIDSTGRLEAVSSGLRSTTEAAQRQITEQGQLLAHQATVAKELERIWPQLFATYLDRFKQTSNELATSWDALYQRVNNLTNSASQDLSQSAQELVEAIQSHQKTTAARPAPLR
jgi:hypothetical protein